MEFWLDGRHRMIWETSIGNKPMKRRGKEYTRTGATMKSRKDAGWLCFYYFCVGIGNGRRFGVLEVFFGCGFRANLLVTFVFK